MNEEIRHSVDSYNVVELTWKTNATGKKEVLKYDLYNEYEAPDLPTVREESDPILVKQGEDLFSYKVVGEKDGVIYQIHSYSGRLKKAYVAADNQDEAKETMKWIKSIGDIIPDAGKNQVDFTFTWQTERGSVKERERSIDAPDFDDIEHNYTENVRKQLSDLIDFDFNEGESGRICIFHGEPGTGKSYFIRSLGLEWQKYNNVNMIYVVDPEKFIGRSADYLLNVLESDEKSGSAGEPASDSWNVIVLEDTGEMFQSNAKKAIGQGLSRLLNVADGILGQGMNCIFILTTNEPISSLHPAVTRDGRCLANIEFEKFGEKTANKWLENEDVSETVEDEATLAELYALKRDSGVIEDEEDVDIDSAMYG